MDWKKGKSKKEKVKGQERFFAHAQNDNPFALTFNL
jgi:hypothetical protein